jgi:hypothetical protein
MLPPLYAQPPYLQRRARREPLVNMRAPGGRGVNSFTLSLHFEAPFGIMNGAIESLRQKKKRMQASQE